MGKDEAMGKDAARAQHHGGIERSGVKQRSEGHWSYFWPDVFSFLYSFKMKVKGSKVVVKDDAENGGRI